LVKQTLELLQQQQSDYHGFFRQLRQTFSPAWAADPTQIPLSLFTSESTPLSAPLTEQWCTWRDSYHLILSRLSASELEAIPPRLARHNPLTPLVRSEIETVWKAIDEEDHWQPFYDLVDRLRSLS
jgi:uncharacterized protein YdiU (UPF0061 family)